MEIKTVAPDRILKVSRDTLGLPQKHTENTETVDDDFLAALVRHSAGFLCPCSPTTLRSAAMESLQYLVVDDSLTNRIDEAIEMLTIGGDLLELNQTTTDDPFVCGTWLFAAPPRYVVHQSGNIFLMGIVADQDTYLTKALAERIHFDGWSRVLVPKDGEELAEELTELGFQRISEKNWMKCPDSQQAESLYNDFEKKLKAGYPSGAIPGLKVLDPESSPKYYRGRWRDVERQTGVFVARRPQEYGAPVWCFVELQDGEAQKLLDFPLPKYRWRGCDIAWHLQMAIDYMNGNPQRYKLHRLDDVVQLDFFSPLPLWAQRRLMIIGSRIVPEKCLISFRISSREAEDEELFLQDRLWIAPQDREKTIIHADDS